MGLGTSPSHYLVLDGIAWQNLALIGTIDPILPPSVTMPTLRSLSIQKANEGTRTESPCCRCVAKYAEGLIGGQSGDCRFTTDRIVLRQFKVSLSGPSWHNMALTG
jgi:hypothetical protein